MPEREQIDELVGAVCDFRYVDWDRVATERLTRGDRQTLQALREFESVASASLSLLSTKERHGTPAADEALAPGSRWGHLEILERIGEGASAEVFRARDTRLDREVALKLFHPWHDCGSGLGRTVLEEGRLLGQVSHPNVVRVYGADEHDGRRGIWMELVRGQTLAAILAGRRRLSDEEARTIGTKLCQALAAVHDRGLVHGDVKLQNVVREDDGRIVLMDFSATRPAPGKENGGRQAHAGTPLYMAPELFAGELPTPAADIYAVGVLLYYLVAGHLGAQGAGTFEELPTLRDVRPDVSESFLRVVERATAHEKAKRYRSAGELERALRDTSVGRSYGRIKTIPTLAVAAALAIAVALASNWHTETRTPIRAIAVPLMSNETGAREGDALAEATTFGIVERLAQLQALRVLSPTAVAGVAGDRSNWEAVAQKLRVDGLLLGRFRSQDASVVLYAELVDDTGATYWSERFEQSADDPTSLERRLVASLVTALGVAPSGAESVRLAERHTENPDAYRLYRLGRHFASRREEGVLRKAIDYFEQAVTLDPGYAQAHSGLADAYALLNAGYYQPVGDIPMHVALLRAREEAEKALELNDRLPEAHTSMAMVHVMSREPELAEEQYRIAIELAPSHPSARQWYSRLLSSLGRHEEGLRHAKVAVTLDPVSPLAQRTLGFAYYDAREYDRAIAAFLDTLELDETFPFTRHSLALASWYRGDATEAIRHFSLSKPWLGELFTLLHEGRSSEAMSLLRSNEASEPSWIVPVYYALAGDYDQALERLARAQSAGDENVSWTVREAAFDPLINDARFRTIVERSGVTWRWGMDDLGS